MIDKIIDVVLLLIGLWVLLMVSYSSDSAEKDRVENAVIKKRQ